MRADLKLLEVKNLTEEELKFEVERLRTDILNYKASLFDIARFEEIVSVRKNTSKKRLYGN